MSSQIAQRPTFAEINLDNLASNFHASKNFIGNDLKYMAVVKADAYGHDAIQCARRLEKEGVDWFGVAIPEEGVELRKAGISTPILCLGSFWQGQEVTIVVHDLTTVIFTAAAAIELNNAAVAAEKILDVHVKVDTGMGRVGVRFEDATEFAADLSSLSNINVSGLLTHFAAADDPSEDEFTNLQIERFESVIEVFRAAGHSPSIIDLANSPAAIRHQQSHGNLVRLGGALYGLLDDILPKDTATPSLKPVLSLKSAIADIKNVPAGESLGYSRTFVTKRDSQIALVPVGYADGYPRGLSNNANVIIGGEQAPVVGRISMDWTLVDVTDITNIKIGEIVTLIGSENSLAIKACDLASHIGTIGYEITCGISARVPRVFTGQ